LPFVKGEDKLVEDEGDVTHLQENSEFRMNWRDRQIILGYYTKMCSKKSLKLTIIR
jgi:hypothetical protein